MRPTVPPDPPGLRPKRDVVLEFVSNPDAVLNALHQAGWAIMPQAELERLREELGATQELLEATEADLTAARG